MFRNWKKLDLKKMSIPESICSSKDSMIVNEGIQSIDDVKVFYREALPNADSTTSALSVLLLHGIRFTSKTWLELGTIQMLAAMGYRTVAIDLPGLGNSPAAEIAKKGDFLQSVIKKFDMSHPVIVSPSFSGFYTLPYLLKDTKILAGYIPVAPVGIEVLEALPPCTDSSCKDGVYAPLKEFLDGGVPDLSHIKTPTMVVFGEKDRSKSSAYLSLLPNSQCQEIPNGSHPAYLDDPDLWHQLLYNFLSNLLETCSQ